ncbi:hypothetical protein [Caballeronia sp. dw_276]|uniref:hypothetical protein n=1 Tax=Caballeronia sp. dw_276 TaxID=2719795 RepID=UPI001BD3FDAA|nr:hypothetical protein [Caballeronia sp. dw_276]
MKRTFLPLFACFAMAACGGGDGGAGAAAKVANISFYGNPLPSVAAGAAVAKIAVAPATSDTAASDGAATTVKTLTDALAAQGVTASVTPQVLNGTGLHALIMGENNGLPPTDDQFKTDQNGWLVVNFELDDMVTPMDDPKQQAALATFQQDMFTFIRRAGVTGKFVFIILPIPTCDAQTGHSAADGLIQAISGATAQALAFPVGGLPSNWVVDQNGVATNTFTQGHLGDDCRTPDAYLLNAWTTSIATRIAPALKEKLGS